MKNKLKKTAVMFAFLALLTITTGVTMAFFTYNGTGETLNTITVGGLTFHYKELDGKGRGISITDAMPVSSNDDAKTGDKYFSFKVTSSTTGGTNIPYVVTARMNPGSDEIMGNIIDIYLTDDSDNPTPLFSNTIPKYNELEQYDQVTGYTEKIIYADTVTSSDYEKNFRLRMWIDQNTELNTGDGTSDYNNKQFSITVNVNATGSLADNSTNPTRLSEMIIADNELETATPNLGSMYPTFAGFADNNFNGNVGNFPVGTYASRYMTYSETYSFDSDTGRYSLGTTNACIYSECYETLKGKYIVSVTGSDSSTPVAATNLAKIYKIMDTSTADTMSYIVSSYSQSYDSTDSGLYAYDVVGQGYGGSTTGGKTYYFRGAVENNYVEFADMLWRVIRVNEDGSTRLILDDSIDTNGYKFNSSRNQFENMYYSNSDVAKPTLDSWYNTNIKDKGFESNIAVGNYFCEQSKVKGAATYPAGNATITIHTDYTPTYNCETDGNGKGLLDYKIGLITYDEVIRAGGFFTELTSNPQYYLYKGSDHNNNYDWWTMSLAGFYDYDNAGALDWYVKSIGSIYDFGRVTESYRLRPVINLKAETTATRSNGHYIVDID